MNNLVLFINSFLSYLLVFGVFALAIVSACFLGIGLRKMKNNKVEKVKIDAEEQ